MAEDKRDNIGKMVGSKQPKASKPDAKKDVKAAEKKFGKKPGS